MNNYYVTSCMGKIGYESGVEAGKAKDRMKRKKNSERDQGNLNIYRCRFCACWHIGRRQKRVKLK